MPDLGAGAHRPALDLPGGQAFGQSELELGRAVRAEMVPRDTWPATFASQGMKNFTPRMRMLDGFNEWWIEFEGGASGSRKCKVQLMAALRDVVTGQFSLTCNGWF